jgi:hypothetical protein
VGQARPVRARLNSKKMVSGQARAIVVRPGRRREAVSQGQGSQARGQVSPVEELTAPKIGQPVARASGQPGQASQAQSGFRACNCNASNSTHEQ